MSQLTDISRKLQFLSKKIEVIVNRISDPADDRKNIAGLVADADSAAKLLNDASVDHLFKYFTVCPTKPDAPVQGEQTYNFLNTSVAPELITQTETAKKYYIMKLEENHLDEKSIDERVEMLTDQISDHNDCINEVLEKINSILLPKFQLKQSVYTPVPKTRPADMTMLNDINGIYWKIESASFAPKV